MNWSWTLAHEHIDAERHDQQTRALTQVEDAIAGPVPSPALQLLVLCVLKPTVVEHHTDDALEYRQDLLLQRPRGRRQTRRHHVRIWPRRRQNPNASSPSPFYRLFPGVPRFCGCQAFWFHRTDLQRQDDDVSAKWGNTAGPERNWRFFFSQRHSFYPSSCSFMRTKRWHNLLQGNWITNITHQNKGEVFLMHNQLHKCNNKVSWWALTASLKSPLSV